ncbi:MAG: PilZ domain-containing protein [Bradymonadia bacterium]
MTDPFDPQMPALPPRVHGETADPFGPASPTPIGRDDLRSCGRVPLDIYVNQVIDGQPFIARARDLSPFGLRVGSILTPETRDRARIALEFMLPGSDEVIWAPVEPVHRKGPPGTTGFRFVRMARRHARMIESYIQAAA